MNAPRTAPPWPDSFPPRRASARANLAIAFAGALALAAIVALAILGWPADMYRRADMPQFWLAPRTLLEGQSPYARWDWPYPLWTAIVLLPLGALEYELAAPVWLVAQLLAIGFALLALGRLLLVDAPRRDRFVLFGLAAASQPLWLLVGGGNMTGLLFAALAGALVAQLSRRPLLAGALLGLLTMKPSAFLLAAPAFVLAAPRAARARIASGGAAVVAALVAASFAAQADWLAPWIANLAGLGTSVGSNATGWTVGRASPSAIPAWLTSGASLVAATLAFAVWWWLRRPPFAVVMAGAIAISLYVAPHGWSYDQLHLFITYTVALGLLARLPGDERRIWLLPLAAIAAALPWALYSLAFVTGGEEWSALIPLLAFALIVAIDARVLAASRAASGTTAEQRFTQLPSETSRS